MTHTNTRLYGTATAQAWNRLHPRLTRRSAWIDHNGPLPIIEGTMIRLTVEHLPSGGVNKPVWLWCSAADAGPAEVDRYWQMFLRRFDVEHTFRLLKQPWVGPGPSCAALRRPTAGPGWSWPPTPNYAWPARWSPTCATPGNAIPNPPSSPRPASGAGSATSI
ncbi:hypothetical protein Q5530_11595 [Saccharothrix sp. BKS2]|uniref:hypothetical protein n=1 Tax=Saccharothrix sp. BKS2 TaxID=3064400 RepID=UPI0039EBDE6E